LTKTSNSKTHEEHGATQEKKGGVIIPNMNDFPILLPAVLKEESD
jgi:hypothetical protein